MQTLLNDLMTDPPAAANARLAFDYADITRAILAQYDPRTTAARPLRVLEAGGGSSSWLPLPADSRVTTIDISAEQLARNTYAHERLLGDLQTFDYGERRFDLVICWDVLEHLERPADAVARLARTLTPGGRLIVKGPLKHTVKGLLTRLTPHFLHVVFYRHILKSASAGLPGHPPFRAYLAEGSDPADIAPTAAGLGLVVEHIATFETAHVEAIAQRSRLLLAAYRVSERLLTAVTLGHYRSRVTDFFLIARRPD